MKTYKEQFDHLTRQYIENKIEPYDAQFCFCGNLLNNTDDWIFIRNNLGEVSTDMEFAANSIKVESDGQYTPEEIVALEAALLTPLIPLLINKCSINEIKADKDYEDLLFIGFCNALELLKKFHIQKGEKVDESLVLNKREKPEYANI